MSVNDETARLAALHAYDVLDTPRERDFDEVADLASKICGTPIGVVNLIGEGRQFFKAEVGLGVRETPLDSSFCAKAILEEEFLVVPDATKDPRFDCNPLVTGEPGLRFYAGALLKTAEGHAIGTVCVLDVVPHDITPLQEQALRVLARQVMRQLELRRALVQRDAAGREARETEVRYHQILDSAVDYAIITTNLDGNVTSWNSGAENILGWSETEMCGQPAHVFFTPEDIADGVPEQEMQGAREIGRGSDERWHVRKDGSRFFALGEMMPLKSEAGVHVGYLKILRDRTLHRVNEERSRDVEMALAASEERTRLAVDATGIGIFDFVPDTGSLRWDARVRDLFGVGPDEPVSYDGTFLPGLHPDDREAADAAVRSALEPGGPGMFDIEYRVRSFRDGGERWLAARGKTIFEGGRAVRFVGSVRDVTTRRTAELALRVQEERYRLVTRATNDAIWDWDLVRDHVLWNEALHTAYGYDLAHVEPTGAWWLDRIHPDDRPGTEEDIHATIAGAGDEWSHEYRFRRADDTYADVLDRGYMVRGTRGEPVRMIGAMLDLSERKRDERRLREMNALLEARVEETTRERDRAWQVSQDLLVVAEQDGRLASVNAAWTTHLGWNEEELVGSTFMELAHPDDLEPTFAAFAGVFERPLVVPYEYRLRHRAGNYRWFAWTAAFEDGRVYASGRDVTAEKEQADALQRAEEQLRQSQKMEAVGQLTGGLAHDFNNLLAGISGSLELMQTRMSQGRLTELDRYMNAASGAAKRAAALTHRLLAFSRRQTLDPKPTDVNRLVRGMEELVRRTVGPAITVEVVAAGGLWATLVDPPQLENALLNLCINARDAMPEGGRLTVETGNRWLDWRAAAERDLPPGQYVSLCVSDTGTGMTPDVIAKAFDPFFTTKPIGQGTGLGLSMIYGFARQSGGQVRIYSEPGDGTMVCIYLPRLFGAEETADVPLELADAPRAEAGETVLVVDDEPTVRMLVTEVLQELGYAAIEAADGPSGLKVLQSDTRIDLLVTDVGLPGGMNGRQMADAARVTRPDLNVLFITGFAENALVGNGLLGAGMQVMTKPFAMEALASRIKEMITGRPESSA